MLFFVLFFVKVQGCAIEHNLLYFRITLHCSPHPNMHNKSPDLQGTISGVQRFLAPRLEAPTIHSMPTELTVAH